MPARRTSNSFSGASQPGSSTDSWIADDLARWGCVASHRSGAARPHGSPGAALNKPMRASSGSAPGLPCGSPRGGRGDAIPGPTRPSRSNTRSRPSRRSARPARAGSIRLTTSPGREIRPPDHGPATGADQQKCPSLVGVTSRCCASFRSLRRPDADLPMVIAAFGRFELTGHSADLDEAITVGRDAVAATPQLITSTGPCTYPISVSRCVSGSRAPAS